MVQPILLIENYQIMSAHIGRDGQIKDKRVAIYKSAGNACLPYGEIGRLIFVPEESALLRVYPHNCGPKILRVKFTEYGYGDVYDVFGERKPLGQIPIVWDAETPIESEYKAIQEKQQQAALFIQETQERQRQELIDEAIAALMLGVGQIAKALVEENPKKARRFVAGRRVYSLHEMCSRIPQYAVLNDKSQIHVLCEAHRKNPYLTKQIIAYAADVIRQRYAKNRPVAV